MESHCNCPVLLDFSLKRDPVELHYANRNLPKSACRYLRPVGREGRLRERTRGKICSIARRDNDGHPTRRSGSPLMITSRTPCGVTVTKMSHIFHTQRGSLLRRTGERQRDGSMLTDEPCDAPRRILINETIRFSRHSHLSGISARSFHDNCGKK